MRIVAFTAVMGDYPPPHVQPIRPDVPLICFTDRPRLRIPGYDIRVVPPPAEGPARGSKFLKVMAHEAVPDAEWAIWFDTSVMFKTGRVSDLVQQTAAAGAQMAVHRHAVRSCVYDEAETCKDAGLDCAHVIDAQMARYRANQYPAGAGLWENTVLVRRLADPGIRALNAEWWMEIQQGSRRDQLSLPVVVRRLGIRVHALPATVYNADRQAIVRGPRTALRVSILDRGRRRLRMPREVPLQQHVDAHYYRSMYPDVVRAGWLPAEHFEQFGCDDSRAPHALFDPVFYGGTYADYLTTGWRQGRDPHPLFDSSYYLEAHPDVARAGLEPLTHFLAVGAHEQRDTHVLFDPAWYRARHIAEVAGVFGGALGHYLTSGWRRGYRPNAWFCPASYLQRYPDVAATGMEPLTHYIRYGIREGRSVSEGRADTTTWQSPRTT